MPVNNTFVPDSSHPLPVYIDSSATINVVITAPIILDSSSSTTLTFLDSSNVAHAVSAANPLPVNASVSIPGSLTVIQPTGTNLHTVVDSGTITNITNPVHVLPDTSNVVVQGSVTVIQPIGSQLHTVLDTSNVNVVNTVTVSGTVGISGQVHTILDTSAVTVIGTIPVSIASPIHVLPDTSNVNVVNPIYVNGNVTVVQPTGSNLHVALDNSNVNVTNFPTQQHVFLDTSAVTFSGNVTVVQPIGSQLHTVLDTSNVNITNFPAVQPISGTITGITNPIHVLPDTSNVVIVGTVPISFAGNVTVVQPTGTNLHVVQDNSSVIVQNSVTVVQPTGSNLHVVLDTSNVNITNFPATQAVSGTVTVIQPTGSNLHAVLDTSNVNVVNFPATQHVTLDTSGVIVQNYVTVVQPTGSNLHVFQDNSNVNVINPVTVVQPTGSNLHVALDNSNVNVTNFPATQVVSGTVTVVQPTGTNLHVVQDTSVVIPASANAISTAVLEGNKVPLSVDLNSNLRTTSGVLPIQTVIWDNTIAQDTTSVLNVIGYGTVVIAFQPVNVTSGILTFEISDDGSVYYPISLILKDAATINNPNIFNTWDFFLQGTANNTLYANISGYRYFRVRLSQVIVGSAGVTVTLNMQASSSSVAPITFVKQWTPAELNATVYGASVDGGNTTTKVPVIVGRANAALPTWSEGKLSPISTDLKGRARVLIDSSSTTTVQQLTGTNLHVVVDNSASNITQRFGTPVPQTAAWTSATSANSDIRINTTGLGTVVLTYNPVGTIASGGIVFEASDSDGTSWFSIGATRQNQGLAFTTENSYSLNSVVQNWQANVSAYTNFRARLTVVIVDSGTANLRLLASASTSEPSVVVGQSNATLLNATVVGTISGVDNAANSVTKIPVINSRANYQNQTWTEGNQVPLSVDTSGNLRVIGNSADNSPAFGAVGTKLPVLASRANSANPSWAEGNQTPLSVDTSGNLRVVAEPSQSGGVRPFHLVSAATTNATVIKPGAGQVYGWEINSSINGFRKVCFHNTASTPVAGSGIAFTVALDSSARSSIDKTIGVFFSTGIAITTVTGHSDVDSSAVGLNDLDINIFYQ